LRDQQLSRQLAGVCAGARGGVAAIRERDVLLHHPDENQPVGEFLETPRAAGRKSFYDQGDALPAPAGTIANNSAR